MIRPCPACEKKNRVPAKHLADSGRCGACGAELPAVAEPLEASPELFADVVREARVPVLVDFWAEWCGPCRMAAPAIEQIARHMSGRALVLKVDTDRYPALAAQFGVRGIPNFVVLKDGRVRTQQAGLVPPAQMERWLLAAGA